MKVYLLAVLVVLSSAFVAAGRSSEKREKIPVYAAQSQKASCEQPQESYVTIEKTRVRYVEEGTGPAVVLIHGNAGSVDDFDFKNFEVLCRAHRLIAIDRPGHGKSDGPKSS